MSNTATRRPYAPRMPAEQRREQILDAALELICSGGIEAVTVDAVAKAIGVTRPVVYSQFTDSNNILRESLNREGNLALAQLAAIVPKNLNDAEPTAVLTDMTRSFLETVLSTPNRWRSILLPAYGGSPPAWQKFKKRAEATAFEVLTGFLKTLVGARQKEVDLELAAHALLRAWEEAGRLALADPEAYTVERLTTFYSALFSVLLTAPEDTS
jgi:AcrR family transcriptional regulator